MPSQPLPLVQETFNQRVCDISIRVALGGSPADVLRLIVGQGMKVVVSGVVIGLLTALVVTRLLSSLLFGIGAADAFTFTAHDHPACSRIGGLLRAGRTCHYCGTCGSFTQRVKRQGRMKPPMDADGANENRHSSACIGGSFALLSGGTNFRADRDAILSV